MRVPVDRQPPGEGRCPGYGRHEGDDCGGVGGTTEEPERLISERGCLLRGYRAAGRRTLALERLQLTRAVDGTAQDGADAKAKFAELRDKVLVESTKRRNPR